MRISSLASKTLIAAIAVVCVLSAGAAGAQSKKSKVAGKWATDSVPNATKKPTPGPLQPLSLALRQSSASQSAAIAMTLQEGPGLGLTGTLTVFGEEHVVFDGVDRQPGRRVGQGRIISGKDEQYAVEHGIVGGNRFSFNTTKKVATVSASTSWQGEITSDDILTVTRLYSSGKPMDTNPDGTPSSLIFHRSK